LNQNREETEESTSRSFNASVLNEHSWVTPVPATDVFSVGSTSAIDHDSENDQTDDGDNLDDCEPEFSFTVSTGSSKVDSTGDDEADCDPNCRVDVFRPVTDQDSGGVEFGRELFKAKERRANRSASEKRKGGEEEKRKRGKGERREGGKFLLTTIVQPETANKRSSAAKRREQVRGKKKGKGKVFRLTCTSSCETTRGRCISIASFRRERQRRWRLTCNP